MNNKLKQLFIALPFTVLSTTAAANWSTTITAASDYTFNGVSQTDNDPALQASLDYAYDKTKTKYSFAFEIYSKDAEDIHDQYHQSHSHSLLETGNGHAHGHHHHHHPEYSCFIQASEESSHSLLNRLTPEECVPYFNPITKSEYEKVKTKWSEAFLKMIDMAHGAQENGPPTREMVSSPAKAAIESMLRGNAVKTKGA